MGAQVIDLVFPVQGKMIPVDLILGVGLATLDELPYVMGLVRQSFEKQVANGIDA